MAEFWNIPEPCRILPGDNLEERLQVAKDLIQLLRNPGSNAPPGDSREKWTGWIKENLYSFFDRNAYGISPSIPVSTRGEYLTLDITVEEKKSQWRIIFVAESELDDSRHRATEIQKDFEKLLAIKSAYKMMIYSSQKWGSTKEDIRRELQKSLDGYSHHLQGETYIFIDYNEHSEKNGSFIAHIWQSESNGPQKPAKLTLVN
jgi:hypothetical protein